MLAKFCCDLFPVVKIRAGCQQALVSFLDFIFTSDDLSVRFFFFLA